MELTVENGASSFGDERAPAGRRRDSLPLLLTVDEAAALLRTTRRAIYAMIERRQVPGVIRIRRRVLFRADHLLQVVAESQENNGVHDSDQYERLLTVARKRGADAYLMVLLGGDARLRLGEIVAVE